MKKWIAATVAILAAIVLCAGCSSATVAVQPTRVATLRPSPTPVPPPPPPRSWLNDTVLLTIYGRAFGVAPILGRLGMDGSFADLTRQIAPFVSGIAAHDGGRRVRPAVHLIYGLATPCSAAPHCLAYLDDSGVNIVQQYILPALHRGWLVILDDQLGLSNPVAEVRRMIGHGYLRYDNVEVALDPEFRAVAGQPTPGIPVGAVNATEINAAGATLNAYARAHQLRHRKLLFVHQFQPGMIVGRERLRWRYRNLEPVIVADGFGTPGVKAHVYRKLLGPRFRRMGYRGIKLFYPNPYEQAGHLDFPIMTWAQVFGQAPGYDGTGWYRVKPAPSVVVIA